MDNIRIGFLQIAADLSHCAASDFETDGDLPEVDQAITMFKIGEWDDGMNLLQKATEKKGLDKDVRAKTFYNLGLAQTYSGDFEDALVNLKKALMLEPDSSRYQRAIQNVKAEQEKAERLKEQL